MPDNDIAAYVNELPFFDAHSHMAGMDAGAPLDDRRPKTLADILTNDYLAYLSSSCTDQPVAAAKNAKDAAPETPEAQRQRLLPLLEACRGLATYAALREGIRDLHGFDGEDIDAGNWDGLDGRIREAYARYGERAWQRQAMRRAGVVRQVHICQLPYVADHWDSLPAAERQAQRDVLLPSLVIDGFCFTGLNQNGEMRRRSMAILGVDPKDYAGHLDFCRAALDRFVAAGGGSVKLLAAYVRSLRFEEVPEATASRLYARDPESLAGDDLRRLQDHLVWAVLELARERDLPLLVHTGYSQPTAWGDPENLLNLLQSPRLRGLEVGLCHAGWPRSGGALIMARSFRHCYFDLSWLPMLSPDLSRQLMSQAIDMLPMNKIMVGTDAGTAESFYGTAKMVRHQLAAVLAGKIDAGQFGVKTARSLARCILFGNAAEFFNEPEVSPSP